MLTRIPFFNHFQSNDETSMDHRCSRYGTSARRPLQRSFTSADSRLCLEGKSEGADFQSKLAAWEKRDHVWGCWKRELQENLRSVWFYFFFTRSQDMFALSRLNTGPYEKIQPVQKIMLKCTELMTYQTRLCHKCVWCRIWISVTNV